MSQDLPVCLLCFSEIKNSKSRKKINSEVISGTRLFQKLLIFAERRLKLQKGSVSSDFLSSLVQYHQNQSRIKNPESSDSGHDPEVFCVKCSQSVTDLCKLYDELGLIEKLLLQQLEHITKGLEQGCRNSAEFLERRLDQQIQNLIGAGAEHSLPKVASLRSNLIGCFRDHLLEEEKRKPDVDPRIDPSLIKVEVQVEHSNDHDNNDDQPSPAPLSDHNNVDEDPVPVDYQDDRDQDHDDISNDPLAEENEPGSEDSDSADESPQLQQAKSKTGKKSGRRGSSDNDDDDGDWKPATRSNPFLRRRPPPRRVKKPPTQTLEIKRLPKRKSKTGLDSDQEDSDSDSRSQSPTQVTPSSPSNSDAKLPAWKVRRKRAKLQLKPKAATGTEKQAVTDRQKKWQARPCVFCGVSFISGGELMHHMKKVHEERVERMEPEASRNFQCPFCSAKYFVEDTLHVHMEMHRKWHEKRCGSYYRCDGPEGEGCSCHSNMNDLVDKFETMADLLGHQERDHPGMEIFRCSRCEWPHVNQGARDLHELLHLEPIGQGEKICTMQCPSCGVKVKSFGSLQRHFSMTHLAPPLKPFECPKCSSRYYSSHDLKMHDVHVHVNKDKPRVEVEGEFVCDQCAKVFQTMGKLQNHISNCRKRGICDVCGEKCAGYRELLQHLTLVHFPQGRFICPEEDCQKIFQLKDAFTKHVKRHGKREPLLCPHCPRVYDNQNSFRNHLNIAHTLVTRGEERKRTKICQDCGAAYYTAHELKEHMTAKHRTEETLVHQCPLCERTFMVENWMKTHIRRKHKMDWREIPGLKVKRIEIKKQPEKHEEDDIHV